VRDNELCSWWWTSGRHIPLFDVKTLPASSVAEVNIIIIIGPILWAIAVPSVTRCHCRCCRCGLSILHCHSPGVATVARRLRYSYSWLRLILVVVSTVATPGEWQCKIRTGGVRRLAVANGPNIFEMLLVFICFFLRIIEDQLAQDLMDRFEQLFRQMIGIWW